MTCNAKGVECLALDESLLLGRGEGCDRSACGLGRGAIDQSQRGKRAFGKRPGRPNGEDRERFGFDRQLQACACVLVAKRIFPL
jgi:hypothetical protein